MKTFRLKKEDVVRKWYLIDATDQIVGKVAGKIAKILRGKNNPEFSNDVDCGNYVIVTNCEKVSLSGKKADVKKYYHHSFYIGGLKTESYKHLLETHPESIIEHAVKGMLPKNKLRSKMLKRLRIFRGNDHIHLAQNPETFKIA